jgi:DNA polymerase-1
MFAYSCGAAVQTTLYDCAAELPDGTVDETVANNAIDRDAWIASGFPAGTVFSVTPVTVAEPEHFAIFLVKRSLAAIEQAVDRKVANWNNLELFLTGKGNFRDTLATIKGYKANRIDRERPVHYKAIRRYLRRAWGAETVEGIEADDKLATVAASLNYDPDRVVIVSMDKDLMTVPGLLYNAKRKKWYSVTENEALVAFYRQLLMGDATDNIGGCFKAGEQKAEKLIQPGMTEAEMYAAAISEYQMSVSRKGCPYAHMGAEAALLENARLLHLRRAEGEVWLPPGERP